MMHTVLITTLALLGCLQQGVQGKEQEKKDKQEKTEKKEKKESGEQEKAKVRYAVVAHADNPCKHEGDKAKATVKKLFLKQLSQWPDGTPAKPYGRTVGSDEHKAFADAVLEMGAAELARHWLKLKNMNGTTPPKEVRSERMLLKYVAKTKGAFGIVAIDAAKGAEGVRVLFEF